MKLGEKFVLREDRSGVTGPAIAVAECCHVGKRVFRLGYDWPPFSIKTMKSTDGETPLRAFGPASTAMIEQAEREMFPVRELEREWKGRDVLILEMDGHLVSFGKVSSVTKTQFRVNRSRFRFSDYQQVGGKYRARPATGDEIEQAQAELDRRADERQQQADAKSQAEYDALPESIKMARRVRYVFDIVGEREVADMPADILRPLHEWAKATQAKYDHDREERDRAKETTCDAAKS